MKKINASKKISKNALMLFLDIPILILILLTENIDSMIIYPYICLRFIMLNWITLILLFKITKTTIILIKKSEFLSSILSTSQFELSFKYIMDKVKFILNIGMFYMECIVLLYFFTFSIDKTTYFLQSSNTLPLSISLICLNFILVLIRIYINKRCENITNTYK